MTVVFLGGGLAAGVGALAWWLTDKSWTAFLAGAWLVTTALGLAAPSARRARLSAV